MAQYGEIKNPLRELHEKKSTSMQLLRRIGEAQDEETGIKFEILHNNSFCPVLEMPDGRQWTLNWQAILKLAEADGLFKAENVWVEGDKK